DCVSAESALSTLTKASVSVPGTTLPSQPAANSKNAKNDFTKREPISDFISTSTCTQRPVGRTVGIGPQRPQCSSFGVEVRRSQNAKSPDNPKLNQLITSVM